MPEESRIEALKERLGDDLLLDELTDQLSRTRSLLRNSPEEVAEAALEAIGGQAEVEARIAAHLAASAPLAKPDRFPEAHRLAMRALEILDREGARDPGAPRLGVLKPIAEIAVEFVTEYITKSYAERVVSRLRNLYARREAQCQAGTPARRELARARMDLERVAPGFGGGSPLAPLLAAGASVSVLASAFQYLGAIDFGNRTVLTVVMGLLAVMFFLVSSVLLRGAAVARRRCRLIMRKPLAALWETIGYAGNLPNDNSRDFATAAIALNALVWLVVPGLVAVFVL